MSTFVIWIESEIENFENKEYAEKIKSKYPIILKVFKTVVDAINFMLEIKFNETKIIISGKLFKEFIKSFKERQKVICIAPKVIIFTRNKDRFLRNNEEYENRNNIFFRYGGIATKFAEIDEFLSKEDFIPKNLRTQEEVKLTFEYIDTKEKLVLPIFFKALIDKASNDNIENFINELYDTYSEKYEKEKSNKYRDFLTLLGTIKSMQGIPIEILSKHFARLYTMECDFYKDLNVDLNSNKIEKYLPFIKTLYEGVKLESLPLATDNILYRGSGLANDEINKIQDFLNNKKDDGKTIVFSKSFLSFSKDKHIAESFLRNVKRNPKLSKVMFIVEKDKNIGYNLSTHADIENMAIFPGEKEVLFFPFSSFEIKAIKEENIEGEKGYKIQLLYLGKYLKDLENDKSLIINENKLPESEFKTQLKEAGLIKIEKIESINIKGVHNEYKEYEKEIQENKIKNNTITGEIFINDYDIDKDIPIINSFENVKRLNKFKNDEDDWIYENEDEITKNVVIKIDGEIITPFSYIHKFHKKGKYKIEYSFKKELTKTNHMFYKCLRLIKLDLLNFNTKNVENMSFMFYYCNSLRELDLSNFFTTNVTHMNYMFGGCSSLNHLKISNFYTRNVINMGGIFWNCNSLKEVDLSGFNTLNVVDMSNMFNGCRLLENLNLSKFNTEKVENMSCMFDGCEKLTNLNLWNFNTEKVEDMSCMFFNCINILNLDLSNFNTKNVNNMKSMFFGCNSLTNLDLSNFDTINVNDMSCMFYECNSLVSLNLYNFNCINVNDMDNLFDGCIYLKKGDIITKDQKILKKLKSY